MGTLDRETTIVFDIFGKQAFENNIVDSASTTKTVVDIYPQDSQQEPGLQFVDNICSVIRLHKTGKDVFSYYDYIEKMIKEV